MHFNFSFFKSLIFAFSQDTWLYHLTVAAGNCASLKVGTEYEQLIGKLLDVDGDPGERLFANNLFIPLKEVQTSVWCTMGLDG